MLTIFIVIGLLTSTYLRARKGDTRSHIDLLWGSPECSPECSPVKPRKVPRAQYQNGHDSAELDRWIAILNTR